MPVVPSTRCSSRSWSDRWIGSPGLRSLLSRVPPTDPVTFDLVPLAFGATALAASYLPARRATRVDPMEALRSE